MTDLITLAREKLAFDVPENTDYMTDYDNGRRVQAERTKPITDALLKIAEGVAQMKAINESPKRFNEKSQQEYWAARTFAYEALAELEKAVRGE